MKQVKTKTDPRSVPEAKILDGEAYGGSLSSCDGSNPLRFYGEYQQRSNWCWAAVACMVADYYDSSGSSGSGGNCQCGVVNAALGRSDCCGGDTFWSSSPCNTTGYLDVSLSIVGHFAGMTGPLGIGTVQSEIGRCRPIGMRIDDGVGHFMAIYGYGTDGSLYIADPWPGGASRVEYRNTGAGSPLPEYGGSWTHSYLTQP